MKTSRINSSFRDPSGYVFSFEGNIYRKINCRYKENYEKLMQTGLYNRLVKEDLLISHEEISLNNIAPDDNCFKIIKPLKIDFISYPYEWAFSQLKDAALTTLKIQKIALAYDMTLKDCSAYNIQFHRGKPLFIDTLSFEDYTEGRPWVAYKQFCQHFLSPLSLMALQDISFGKLLRLYIDGIPVHIASKLLPLRSLLSISLLIHIHMHARTQKKYEDNEDYNFQSNGHGISKKGLLTLVSSLESVIGNLKLKKIKTEWGDYYNGTNYNDISFDHKKEIVKKYLSKINPSMVWDLGANTGVFSKIALDMNIPTIAFDIDPVAVEKGYKTNRNKEVDNLFLLMDLTNPSPSIGWNCNERMSFIERGPVDTLMALALIHHLVISNNVPFDMVAKFFSEICTHLIVEFIPKDDSMVAKLLKTREDIFENFTEEQFESDFCQFFKLLEKSKIKDSKRILYRFKKIN